MRSSTNLLTLLVAIALALGVLIGHFALYDASRTPEATAEALSGWFTAGEFIFIRPLMLMIIPLVFTSVLTGITSIGDPKKLGVIGGATLLFYVSTMILAITVGVFFAAFFKPGVGFPSEQIEAGLAAGRETAAAAETSASGGLGQAWISILEQLIPTNFFQVAAGGEALSVITATILLAIGLVAVGERARPFVAVVEALHEALMTIIRWLLWLLPLGVVFLVAGSVGQVGLAALADALGKYMLVVLGGLALHAFVSLPLVLGLIARVNPYKYMWSMKPALLTAFSTSSSMATLPVTIETAADQAGCSRRAAGVVLPLGATVNMDGTALYQGVAVIFLFQVFGIDLTFAEYLIIVLTATLSAVGAAGIPGGSIPVMIIIIRAVNTSLSGTGTEQLPEASIGLILAVDRLLDMCRTSVNVWGDSVGARIISILAPDTPEEREKAFA